MRALGLLVSSLLLLQCSSSSSQRHPSGTKILDTSGYLYDPSDRSCDGFPRLEVQTMPGTCLGLVLPQKRATSPEKPWRFPRTLLEVPGTNNFLAIDMGGWAQSRGALYLLKRSSNGSYDNILLKDKLNMPHALRPGPGGFFYIGETDKIVRFRFIDGKIRDWEVVVAPLIKFKGYMHPLVALAFDPRNNDLYINAGSPSDRCIVRDKGTYSDCPEDSESGLGAIYRVPGFKLAKIPPGGIKQYEVAAQGLRNSMAMVIHPSGWLVQGENGRDFPQLEEPYEELNAIDLADTARGKHFGWPSCNDFHAVSPEWKFSQNGMDPMKERFSAPVDCSLKAGGPGEYQPPHILMPPHVAPLHYEYYPEQGQLAPLLGGKLLASWHGYQPAGQRLVAYKVESRGLPIPEATVTGSETYSFNVKSGCSVQKAFRPEGGFDRFARHEEVISGWNDVKGVRPKGAPVAFTVASDGSIWIAEDKNKTIVRLARSDMPLASSCETVAGPTIDPRIELLAWRSQLESAPAQKAGYEKMRDGILKKYCASCHGGFVEKDIASDGYSQLDFMVRSEFFIPRDAPSSKIWQSLARTGEVPAMPPKDVPYPEGRDAETLSNSVRDWITLLPADLVKTSVKRMAMKENRKIRQAAGVAAKECGQVGPGDVIYIDPRPAMQPKKDGWLWARVYMIPGDSRLFKNACAYPLDGVFHMAVSKL